MPRPTHAEGEQRIRRLLVDNGLPEPDEVDYRPAELVFLYHDQRVVVVFELEEPASAEP